MSLPTIAAPVANPIKIDPGAQYYYVIPQTGAISGSVDTDPDFSLALVFGATCALTLKYTGAIPSPDPIQKNIVIHLTNGEGTTSQTLTFQVGAYSSRKIPNILCPPQSSVASGGTVSMPISTDLDGTGVGGITVNAFGLPPGLSLSAKNIIGAAPSGTGSYTIVLSAGLASQPAYLRYWVLNVAAPVTSGNISVSTTVSSGRIVYDGDYTVAQQDGAAVPVNPIPEDPKPYLYRIKYWQLLDSYLGSTPSPGSAGPNGGYYVGEVPGSFKDVAAGVVEFVREFAFVPDSRNEFESFNYSYQFWQTNDGKSSVTEIPITSLTRVQYDYFHLTSVPGALAPFQMPEGRGGGAPMVTNSTSGWQGSSNVGGGGSWGGTNAGGSITQIDLPKAPRVIQIFDGLSFLDGFGSIVTGSEILAEDATMKQWRGLIFERKQRFVVFIGVN